VAGHPLLWEIAPWTVLERPPVHALAIPLIPTGSHNAFPSQGDSLTYQFITGLLPSLGCIRNFPITLHHGPSAYFGLHLPHVYWEQGTATILTFLSSFQTSAPTGLLLLVTFEQAQLEVGLGWPFLELDFETYGPLLTPCWLRSLWEFLSYAGISLCSSDLVPQLHFQHVGNAFLMDLALADTQWSRKDLLTINHCCLALHCLMVANVAMGNGCYLWAFSFLPLALPSTYLWPREFPSWSDWKIWEKFLLSLVCSLVG